MVFQKLFLFKTAGYAKVIVPYYKQFEKIWWVWYFIFINPKKIKVLKQYNIYGSGLWGRPLITSTIFCHFLTPPLSTTVKHWRTPPLITSKILDPPPTKLQKCLRTFFLTKNAIVDKFHCWRQLLLNPPPLSTTVKLFRTPPLFCWRN